MIEGDDGTGAGISPDEADGPRTSDRRTGRRGGNPKIKLVALPNLEGPVVPLTTLSVLTKLAQGYPPEEIPGKTSIQPRVVQEQINNFRSEKGLQRLPNESSTSFVIRTAFSSIDNQYVDEELILEDVSNRHFLNQLPDVAKRYFSQLETVGQDATKTAEIEALREETERFFTANPKQFAKLKVNNITHAASVWKLKTRDIQQESNDEPQIATTEEDEEARSEEATAATIASTVTRRPITAPETIAIQKTLEANPTLTAEVLNALKEKARGHTEKEIAAILSEREGKPLTESGARTRLDKAYTNMRTQSSVVAIINAMNYRLISPDFILSGYDDSARLQLLQHDREVVALLEALTANDQTKGIKQYSDLVGTNPAFTSEGTIKRIAGRAQQLLQTNDIYHSAIVYSAAKKAGLFTQQEAEASNPLNHLTQQQKDIINLMIQGYDQGEVAQQLEIPDQIQLIKDEYVAIRGLLGIRKTSAGDPAIPMLLTVIDLDAEGKIIDPTLIIKGIDPSRLQKLSEDKMSLQVKQILDELIRDNGTTSTNKEIEQRTGIKPKTIDYHLAQLPFRNRIQAAVYWKMRNNPRLITAINAATS